MPQHAPKVGQRGGTGPKHLSSVQQPHGGHILVVHASHVHAIDAREGGGEHGALERGVAKGLREVEGGQK